MPDKSKSPAHYSSLLVGLAAFATYCWLAPHVAGDGDSSELTLVLARNGVAHPTGYPILTMFGHLFVTALHRLGVGWDFAANAWSAAGGGLSIGLMHAVSLRLVPREYKWRVLLVAIPVALFALNPVWTDVTSLAEVYSWEEAWALTTLLCFVAFLQSNTLEIEPEDRAGRGSLQAVALMWGVLCGFGCAHHAISVIPAAVLTAVLLLVLARHRRLSVRLVAVGLGGAVAPLLSYLTIWSKASRTGPEIWDRLEPSWQSFMAHISGAQYRGFLGEFRPDALQQRFLSAYVYPYLIPGFCLLLLATLLVSGRRRAMYGAMCCAIAAQVLFCLAYGVPDPSSYFLLPLSISLLAIPAIAVVAAESRWLDDRGFRLAGGLILAVAITQWWPQAELGIGRRNVITRLDEDVRRLWLGIPLSRGIVLWGGGPVKGISGVPRRTHRTVRPATI